ncbi:hypothetical protein [Amycolatopsis sp. NPDC051061]
MRAFEPQARAVVDGEAAVLRRRDDSAGRNSGARRSRALRAGRE